MTDQLPVLIVGAGPTGLSMAVELQKYGIPFRLIDKNIKPVITSNALVLQTRSIEMWDDLELLDIARQKGIILTGLEIYADDTHLGSLDTHKLNTLHPYLLGLAQSETEKILLAYLKSKGIKIELEVALTSLKENSNNIEVTLTHKEDFQETLAVDWLIACDGGHSTIRTLIDMPFEGKELAQHFVMGDVKLRTALSPHRLYIFFSKNGIAMIFPFSQDYSRIVFDVTHDPLLCQEKQPTSDQLKTLLQQRCAAKIEVEETPWTSGFWIHERIVPHYRHNKIFFAGDAAHVHSPAGGQGMNTGLQDVYNLGWKLANVILKRTKPQILNSYEEERRPVALGVLSRSTLLTQFGTSHFPFFTYLRTKIASFVLKSSLANKFLAINSQLAIDYRKCSLSKECNKNAPGPRAGDRMLDCWLDSAKTDRLLTYIRGPLPTILVFSGILREDRLKTLIERMETISKKYNSLLNYVFISVLETNVPEPVKLILDQEQTLHRKYQLTIPAVYFLRPDKYIGFRGRMSDFEALFAYLQEIYN